MCARIALRALARRSGPTRASTTERTKACTWYLPARVRRTRPRFTKRSRLASPGGCERCGTHRPNPASYAVNPASVSSSVGVSRPSVAPITASMSRWRAGTSSVAEVSVATSRSRRSSSDATEPRRVQVLASSSASGKPSTRRHSSAIAASVAGSVWGSAARRSALVRKKRTAA